MCSKRQNQRCIDSNPRIIILKQVFDFKGHQGAITELGCWHKSNRICYERGQQKLNVSNQCSGLEPTHITYDKAGHNPLIVGSNKYVIGIGNAGIKGKGFHLYNLKNIVIKRLRITDINPRVIWGGDAISMVKVENILIDGNYINKIGRQMVVTGFGACKKITLSNNEFDGNTPYSAYCDGKRYWMFLFLGGNDRITMFNNICFWKNSTYYRNKKFKSASSYD